VSTVSATHNSVTFVPSSSIHPRTRSPRASHPFPPRSLRVLPLLSCSELQCGCPCNGVEDEEKCPPCLTHQLPIADQLCPLCLSEPLSSLPIIQLPAPCGHVFHHQCVVQQLDARWPHHRLTFTFLLCSLCRHPLRHPSLHSQLSPLLELKGAVEQRALTRLYYEGRERDKDVQQAGGRFYGDELGYALHLFVFYQCHKVTSTRPIDGERDKCSAAAHPHVPSLPCPLFSVISLTLVESIAVRRTRPTWMSRPNISSAPGHIHTSLTCSALSGKRQDCSPSSSLLTNARPVPLLDVFSCADKSSRQCPTHGRDWLAYKCRFCCRLATFFCWSTPSTTLTLVLTSLHIVTLPAVILLIQPALLCCVVVV
jgi:hypothetical protein